MYDSEWRVEPYLPIMEVKHPFSQNNLISKCFCVYQEVNVLALSQDSLHSYMKYGNLYQAVFLNQIPQKFCRNKSISVKNSQCLVSLLCATA